MNLTCVGFDLGYTLVHTHREMIFQKVIKELGIYRDLSEIFEAYHRTDKLFMRDYPGALCRRRSDFMPFYCRKLLEALRIEANAKTILTAFFAEEQVQENTEKGRWFAYESAASALSMLKGQGIHTVLISNWDRTAKSVLRQNGLSGLLDEVVISSKVGVLKPNKEIFEIALSKIGAKPECSLYVGDNYYDDFMGANKAGMHFVLINHFGRIGIEEIRNVDVLSDIHNLSQYLEQHYNIRNEEKT